VKYFFIFFLALGFLSSCDKNKSDDPLDGSWNLSSYSAFLPDLPIINRGDIIWTFNISESTITVENNIDNTYPYLRDSGIYTYVIFNDIITINGSANYLCFFEGNRLVLDSNINPDLGRDNAVLKFVKK